MGDEAFYASYTNLQSTLTMNNVEINLVGIEANNYGLEPRLEFEFEARSSGRRKRYRVISASAQIEVGFEGVKKVSIENTQIEPTDIGEIDHQMANPISVAYFPSHRALDTIEEYRRGGGLTVEFSIKFTAYDSHDEETKFERFKGSYSVEPHEWASLLEDLDYHDVSTFEIDLGGKDARTRDVLSSVSGKLTRAKRRHDEGDYESAIRACRDAIESLRHIDERVKETLDTQKWERFDESLGSFETGFVGLLCHSEDMTNAEPPLKRDSDFVLAMTQSYFRFISTVIEEELSNSV